MLTRKARERGVAVNDLACTLLGVIAAPDVMVAAQIGDGAIVVPGTEPERYAVAFWPQHGEYANTTNFVTQKNASDIVEVLTLPPVHAFAMFSDGLERLILNEAAHSVHAPAIQPIVDWARTEADPGVRARALTAYLTSEHINRRSDDDKSLVIAVRAPVG
jgi:hypothetical protein